MLKGSLSSSIFFVIDAHKIGEGDQKFETKVENSRLNYEDQVYINRDLNLVEDQCLGRLISFGPQSVNRFRPVQITLQ